MLTQFRKTFVALTCLAGVTACNMQPSNQVSTKSDFTATALVRSSWTAVPVVAADTATPVLPTSTIAPTIPTVAPTDTTAPTATIGPTLIPTNTRRPTITLTPSPAVTTISTIVPGSLGGDTETWTPMPLARQLQEHFVFARPISSDNVNYWARNYSYGSTDNGQRPTHHGLDFENPTGTPALAAGSGIVFYAGNDTDLVFGPQPNFYGNVVVIQHNLRDSAGRTIYTLYGHLSKIDVNKGQSVRVGDQIGEVGSAGIAIGPHLHLEVRAGNPTNYNAVLNGELWVAPFTNNGVLAGRVMDLDGHALSGVTVEIQSLAEYRSAYSYADNTVNSDPTMGENYVIPDLPTGYYTVFVKLSDALAFRTVTYIHPGHVNWLDININPSMIP
jgi:murein DD-endopeptidase MepM/ murein hydrolase activator NlpD